MRTSDGGSEIARDAPADLVARVDQLLREHPPAQTSAATFWEAQFDLGLAWVRFPKGRGGLGLDQRWQAYVDDCIRQAGGPTANRDDNVVGLAMAAPTLMVHAPADLQARLLKPLFSAREIWCQLFSEPGAGSDIASLATAAKRVDDRWIVNGQKVWTTLAHRARWGLLLARTDPNVPKHKGLTYFIVDMHTPGVTVRPLFEITGEAEFNEVYLEDVEIPDAHRLGAEGDGWKVAITTLMNERASAGREIGARGSGPIATALDLWSSDDGDFDPVRRSQLADLWASAEVLRLTEIRAAMASGSNTPGPEGSVAKLRWSELNQSVTEFTMSLIGLDALSYPGGYEFTRPDTSQVSNRVPQKAYLRSRANSIEGGTSQIMRNILAERVLGLPGEAKDDREKAWKDIPRG